VNPSGKTEVFRSAQRQIVKIRILGTPPAVEEKSKSPVGQIL
jgi:hypothetical protein